MSGKVALIEMEVVATARGPREYMLDAIATELCVWDGVAPMERINVGYECGDPEIIPRMKSVEYQEGAQRIMDRLLQFKWSQQPADREGRSADIERVA